jgi:hypothetical protein
LWAFPWCNDIGCSKFPRCPPNPTRHHPHHPSTQPTINLPICLPIHQSTSTKHAWSRRPRTCPTLPFFLATSDTAEYPGVDSGRGLTETYKHQLLNNKLLLQHPLLQILLHLCLPLPPPPIPWLSAETPMPLERPNANKSDIYESSRTRRATILLQHI